MTPGPERQITIETLKAVPPRAAWVLQRGCDHDRSGHAGSANAFSWQKSLPRAPNCAVKD